MKNGNFRKYLCFLLIFVSFTVFAKPASSLKIREFKLKNGIPVYLRTDKNSEFSTVSIVVKGGVNYYDREYSGIEKAVFDMISTGSDSYSIEDLRNFFYRTSSDISSATTKNGSVYSLKSINYYFDEAFDVFVDVFLHPGFSEKEFSKLVISFNQKVQSMMNNPSSLVSYYFTKETFENHPYSASAGVLPDSVKNITLDAVKKYYGQMIDSRRIAVVLAGDFDENHVVSLLNEKLGNIKAGKEPLKDKKIEKVQIGGDGIVLAHPSAKGSGYAIHYYNSPDVEAEDFYSLDIATDIYSDVLYNVVRETYGDCYTPQSFITGGHVSFAGEVLVNVSNLKDFAKHTAIARKIMSEGKVISGKDENGEFIFEPLSDVLESYKNIAINRKYHSEETVLDLNYRMASSILSFNDPLKSEILFEKIKSVTSENVLDAFNEYFINGESQWYCVVGEGEENLVDFGE